MSSSWSPIEAAREAVGLAPPVPQAPGSNFVGTSVGAMGDAFAGLEQALGRNAPQFAGLDLDRASMFRDYDLAARQAAASRGTLTGNYASDLARNQLAQQGIGLDREDLARQRAGLDLDRAGLGLRREGIGVDRNYIGQMMGLADRALDTTIGGIDRNQATTLRNIASDFTSRGAWFAPFQRLDRQDAIADAEQARTEARYSREGRQYGWDRDLANLGLDERGIGLDDQRLNLRYGDLDTANRRLDLEAERLGLSRGDLERALNEGLTSLGLQNDVNLYQLIDGLAGNDLAYRQMWYDVLAASPELAPFLMGAFSAGAGAPVSSPEPEYPQYQMPQDR
ncbi:MAG: hypothetical protein ACF8PN_08090 [Phycisphaerales bacterium]